MRWLARAGAVAFSCAVSGTAAAAPWDKPGYTLTFHDEFDGIALDPAEWGKRYKWGEAVLNGELQAYVDDAFQFDGGILGIVAAKRQGTYAKRTMNYTSGLIASVHEQTYGFFEMRCQMPKGQGLWPAFWLLGSAADAGVNEIDIHEFLGSGVNTVYTTLHWGPSYAANLADGKAFAGPDFTAGFHTFAVDWDPNHVVWYIDGAEVHRHEGVGVPHVAMYVIANLAVGGNWPQAPNATTLFPAYYDVDYIRAYQLVPDAGAGADAGARADAAPSGFADGSANADATVSSRAGSSSGGHVAGEAAAAPPSDGAAPSIDAAAAAPPVGSSKGCSCSVVASHRDLGGADVLVAGVVLARRPPRRRRPAIG